jgi:hypothetical protein
MAKICRARATFPVVLAMVSLGVLAPRSGAVEPLPATWLRGVHLTGYEPDTFSGGYAPETHAALHELKADGGNLADFVQECLMTTYQSTTIDCATPNSETDASLAAGMQYARSLGLQVALNPHVDTEDSYGRGFIEPSSWGEWWDAPGGESSISALSYDGMILHYAALAQQYGASIYYVGTELDSASICPAEGGYPSCAGQWQNLIAEVRQIFHGKIVYAASVIYTEYPVGSGQYTPAYNLFPAWDAVDMIGVDSYFELDLPAGQGGVPDPGVPALNAAWNSFGTEYDATTTDFADLHALATKYGKPVFASEIGYSDGAYSAHDPASTCPDESNPCTDTVDLQAQADAYESFFETFANAPWFAGMVLWDFQVDQTPSQAYIQVDPRGTPAEQVIKDWWTATRQRVARH